MQTLLFQDLVPDVKRLFATRMLRMFAYGFLSVILGLYLIAVGLNETRVGVVLTLTLLGDATVTLWLSTRADRLGRRIMLLTGAALMMLAGVGFAITDNLLLLTLAAIIGTISPTGNEVGAALAIEQASLSQLVPSEQRTTLFAWYNLLGSFSTALGALMGGVLVQTLLSSGWGELESYRVILWLYSGFGLLLGILFLGLTPAIEIQTPLVSHGRLGLTQSSGLVLRLSALFALDSFGGGLIVQTLIAYWFQRKFGVDVAVLGGIFFGANLLAGLSALAAARIAARIGLINTMVFTHIPSNILLMLVPLMPTLPLAVGVLLIRFSISQMDVPTRQSYVMAVVDPSERSAAAGITTLARSLGSAVAPLLTGVFLAQGWLSLPFFLAGGLKIIYDVSLYRSFQAVKPPEEQK